MQICCVKGRCRCKWISTRRISYLRSADSALSPMPSLLKLKSVFAARYDLYLDTCKWSSSVTWLHSCAASWSCFFTLQRLILLHLHIAGVSIKAWDSHIKEDGLKENREVFKIIPSTPKNTVLGQKSEVTAETRASQTGKIDGCGFFLSTSSKQKVESCKGTASLLGCISCDAPSKVPSP